MKRVEREIRTVGIMIDAFCRHHHGSQRRCPDCRELFEYARLRSFKCPYGEGKPVCGRCPVHCYKSEMTEKIRTVMRYSGPRMIFSHPILAIRHAIDTGTGRAAVTPPEKNVRMKGR
jgi:hypothetical protein